MARTPHQDLSPDELAAIQEIAASHGYTIGRGRDANKGSRRQLEAAIVKGEVALVLLPDEQRAAAIHWINANITLIEQSDWIAAEGLKTIAESLNDAARRED